MSRARRLAEIAKANEPVFSGTQWWLADPSIKPEKPEPPAPPSATEKASPQTGSNEPSIPEPVLQHTEAVAPVAHEQTAKTVAPAPVPSSILSSPSLSSAAPVMAAQRPQQLRNALTPGADRPQVASAVESATVESIEPESAPAKPSYIEPLNIERVFAEALSSAVPDLDSSEAESEPDQPEQAAPAEIEPLNLERIFAATLDTQPAKHEPASAEPDLAEAGHAESTHAEIAPISLSPEPQVNGSFREVGTEQPSADGRPAARPPLAVAPDPAVAEVSWRDSIGQASQNGHKPKVPSHDEPELPRFSRTGNILFVDEPAHHDPSESSSEPPRSFAARLTGLGEKFLWLGRNRREGAK